MNLAAYTLRAELRNELVYIELLQNDDTYRGTLSRRFRSIAEAEAEILRCFGATAVSVLLPYTLPLRRYRVQTSHFGLIKFGFSVSWIDNARGLRIRIPVRSRSTT